MTCSIEVMQPFVVPFILYISQVCRLLNFLSLRGNERKLHTVCSALRVLALGKQTLRWVLSLWLKLYVFTFYCLAAGRRISCQVKCSERLWMKRTTFNTSQAVSERSWTCSRFQSHKSFLNFSTSSQLNLKLQIKSCCSVDGPYFFSPFDLQLPLQSARIAAPIQIKLITDRTSSWREGILQFVIQTQSGCRAYLRYRPPRNTAFS